MGTTSDLARFIAEDELSAVPREVVDRAKIALTDGLGCALAGAPFESSAIVLDYIRDIGGAPQATIIGTGLKASPADAALANGMLASALLYDDTSLAMHGHSTATLLPVLLAYGEMHGKSGRELIEAYLVGFEVEAVIGAALEPEHYEHGWHATATIGALGATAAACRLLSLPARQVSMALGIATSHAGGARQNFGTMMQAFHGGMPARNGVVAAELARRGFTADANMLEAPRGFLKLFGPPTRKVEADTSRLGKSWALERPVLALKLYPCGFPVFRPIEATMELAIEHDIDPGEVEDICCRVHYLIPETVFHVNPRTGLEGKTSLPYAVSRALIDRGMGLAQFTDEKVQDRAVREIMKRVRVEVLPGYGRDDGGAAVNSIAAPAIVDITLKDGRTLSRRVEHYRGDPNRPLGTDDVAAKFRDCAGAVLDADAAEAVLDMMVHLEDLENTRDLIARITV